MKFRFLPFLLLPMLGMAQSNSNGEVPLGGNTYSEKQPFEIKRNASFNLDEIKVRWKKAALENCPGVPCPSFTVPGPVTNIVVTPLPSAASVAFKPPANNGGSPITGYIVTATPTTSAPAKRKSSATITAEGKESPILVKGLTPGVNYIFSVVATNAAGGSPSTATPNPVTPCSTLNTAGDPSSEPTVVVNTGFVEISILTKGATGIGTPTGLPLGVRATWEDQIFITGEPSEVGIFNYSIPLTGGCGDVKASGKITVTKAPDITVPNAPVEVIATAGNGFVSVAFKAPANNGGSEILDYTVTSNPGNIFVTGNSSPIKLEDLSNGTPYTFTVVARNAVGPSLPSLASSPVTPLTPACPISQINDKEGNTYKLVSIGTQCWMQENLRVTKYNDGTEIPLNTSGGQQGGEGQETWSALKTGAYCVYGNQPKTESNFENYGYLYNWYAAKGVYATGPGPVESKNICPEKMHVPSVQEWNILKNYLGGEDQAGGKMKSTSLWITSSTDNNASGFSALPGGFRVFNSGSFGALGYYAVFQSSTADPFGFPDVFILENSNSNLRFSGAYEKSVGASVRCLLNQN